MPVYFLDASAIVKRYVVEPGSTWVRSLYPVPGSEGANQLVVSRISQAEVAAAFAILERTGRIKRPERDDYYDDFLDELSSLYRIVEIAPVQIEVAGDLTQRQPLKAYDAVQLAVALEVHSLLNQRGMAMTFVSGDAALLKAAQTEGLTIENPFDHP